ncbi:MAG: leucine-rich repeat domain-containing protein [Promethearchaeota archaeon]
MSKLTPEQIFNRYQDGEIDKATAINYLKILLKNSDNGRVRRAAVKFLGIIGAGSGDLYEFFEHLLVSDNYKIVRGACAEVLIQNYLDRCAEVIRHAINHDQSANCLLTILEALERNSSEKSKSLIKYWYDEMRAWLKELFNGVSTEGFDELPAREFLGVILLTENAQARNFALGYVPKIKKQRGHVVGISLENVNNIGRSFLKFFPYLTELALLDSYPGDYTGLSRLKVLNIVGHHNFYFDRIGKIKGLETLVNLERLNLSHNSIRKIEGFDFLLSLKQLDLSWNPIEEIENLGHLKKLEILKLFRLLVSEIKNLEGLINLRELDLSTDDKLGASITELKGLEGLVNLKKLSLANRGVTEIKGLDNLINLEYLDLFGNDIVEINSLDNLVNLRYLNLGCNKITDLKGLEGVKNLRGLSIVGNKIKKIDILEALEGLEVLNVDKGLFIELDILSGLKNLSWLYSDMWFDFNSWFNYDSKNDKLGNQIYLLNRSKKN